MDTMTITFQFLRAGGGGVGEMMWIIALVILEGKD